MRIIAVVAGLVLASLASAPVKADFPISDFLAVQDQRWAQSYMVGVIEAYDWANTGLRLRGQSPLFCETTLLDYSSVRPIVDDYIRREAVEGSTSAGLVVLSALMNKFPC